MSTKSLCCEKDHECSLILKHNKFKEANTFLRSKDEVERERLLHGQFNPVKSSIEAEMMHSVARHPCCIAAIHGSNEVLELLFRWVKVPIFAACLSAQLQC